MSRMDKINKALGKVTTPHISFSKKGCTFSANDDSYYTRDRVVTSKVTASKPTYAYSVGATSYENEQNEIFTEKLFDYRQEI